MSRLEVKIANFGTLITDVVNTLRVRIAHEGFKCYAQPGWSHLGFNLKFVKKAFHPLSDKSPSLALRDMLPRCLRGNLVAINQYPLLGLILTTSVTCYSKTGF